MSLGQDLAILAALGLFAGTVLAWAVTSVTEPGDAPATDSDAVPPAPLPVAPAADASRSPRPGTRAA